MEEGVSNSPVVAAVSPGHHEFLWWACDAAESFRALSEAEEQDVSERARVADPIFSTV